MPNSNVVVIVLDDVGAGYLGAYDDLWTAAGRPSATAARTPAIDQLLAAQGVTFTRVWANPVCTPTRSALLSGRHGFRTGMGTPIASREPFDNPGLTNRETLLPQLLHQAPIPYECAAVGKWHLVDRYQLAADPLHPLGGPDHRWFDRFAGVHFNFGKPPGVPSEEAGYHVWQKYYASFVETGVNPCGAGQPPCIVERDANVLPRDYATCDTIEDALTLAGELQEPYFLYVAPNAIHTPLHEVPAGLPTASCDGYEPPTTACDFPGVAEFPARGRCMLETLDAQIGRLLCALDFNDTTVILVGDNGPAKRSVLAPYLQNRSKNTIYQNGLEVPLIVRSPLIDPNLIGTSCDALVGAIDVFATVLEIAQVDTTQLAPTDSVSFLSCLQDPNAAPRDTLYAETFVPNFTPDPLAPNGVPLLYYAKRHDQALRDARFKLIRKWRRDHQTGAPYVVEELYDLEQGGPLDNQGAPTPDWFEANDLLDSGLPLEPEALASYLALSTQLDTAHPTVMH